MKKQTIEEHIRGKILTRLRNLQRIVNENQNVLFNHEFHENDMKFVHERNKQSP